MDRQFDPTDHGTSMSNFVYKTNCAIKLITVKLQVSHLMQFLVCVIGNKRYTFIYFFFFKRPERYNQGHRIGLCFILSPGLSSDSGLGPSLKTRQVFKHYFVFICVLAYFLLFCFFLFLVMFVFYIS